ncbi:MAG: (2Fe-2S)-binding protein [Deltaproteobacteria bacterium]|nr:(2Fe-2S)-binding protein [Deltaproteobacteria bacterium]
MSGRIRPLRDPVTITLDGSSLQAERGEPVAAALVAAGKLVLARSPKFHRPRGPSCMRAACDGCLARVDGKPNVMTCMVGARDGMEVVSQNRLGAREADLLRMADWFFPDGMNHHELFAGVPGVQSVMQLFARRVAGLGRLPSDDVQAPVRPARRRSADVVVVGGGPAGMAIATKLAAAGRAVEVVDDQLAIGGSVNALHGGAAQAFAPIRASFMDLVARGAVRARPETVAGGLFERDLLVVGPEGAEILEARSLVLAAGAHDGVLAFEGNDVPGVMSARAGCALLAQGVAAGRSVVIVESPGGGPFGAIYAEAVPSAKLVRGAPLRVKGSTRAKGVVVRTLEGKEESFACDAVLVDAPRSPAFELAEQAGAQLFHEPRGYVVRVEAGRIGDGRFAVGELVGTPFDPRAIVAEADVVARTIAAA